MPTSILPIAAMLAAALPTLVLAIRHRLRTGHSPIVLSFADDAAGFQSRLFRMIFVLTLVLLVWAAAGPASMMRLLGTIPALSGSLAFSLGLFAILAGGMIVTLAQIRMDSSWRIGIPETQQDPLVEAGLFARSRNPIYLGIVIAYAGLLLALPNAGSAVLLAAVWISTSTQIRLEEAFLAAELGETYRAYRVRVRRWL